MSVLVGIAGGSGSGKTTVAERIVEGHDAEQVAVIPLDAYYRDLCALTPAERERINYDHPDAFDHPLLMEQLGRLKQGEPIEQPLYDYARHTRREETRRVEAAPVVVLEGILVLALEDLLPLFDLKLYVDTEADVRFLRRLRRDVAARGRSSDSVMDQYLSTVRPMHRRFIEPSRRHADLILPGEGSYEGALAVLRAWIDSVLG